MISVLINEMSKNLYYNIYSPTISTRKITNIGVLFFKLDDPYMSLVKQSLDDIQKKSENNSVRFTFLDSKDNAAIRDEALNSLFTNNFDLLLIDFVNEDENEVSTVVSDAKQKNIPIIIFNFELSTIPEVVKFYDKVVFIATDSRKSGILQGQLIVDKWLANKDILDKNKDNKIQYIMLKGSPGSKATDNRTKNSILTINNAGIETEELASKICNWERELAKNNVESLFFK
jgi:methyl-galactoside transport system substrate-binding protein